MQHKTVKQQKRKIINFDFLQLMGQVKTLVQCGEDCLRGENTSSANSKVVLTNMKVINNENSEGIRQHPLATTDTPEKTEPPESSTPLELQATPQIPNDTPGQTERFATCSGIPTIAMKCQVQRLAKFELEDSAVALPQGAKSPSTRQDSEKNFILHSRDSSCDSGVLSASSSPAADHIKMLMAKDPVEGCHCVSDGRKQGEPSIGHLGALQMSVFSLDEDTDCQEREHPKQSFLGRSQGESLQDKPTEEEVNPFCFSTSPAEEKSLGEDYRDNGWEELPLQEHPLRKYPTSDSLDEYMDTCCRLSQVNEGNAKTYSSGLDYLEHICQLIEKMGQLQEQNLKLQKEICSLQKEQKTKQEYFLKHCSCGAASFLVSNYQEVKNSFPGWSSRPHSLLALNGNVSDLSVIPEIGGKNEKSTKRLPEAEMGEELGASMITPAMRQEEEQLEAEGREEEKQMMEEARMSWARDSSEMRYKRLQHLLEKSNIYSKFLLTKMEQQQLEEQQKKEKLEKKKEANVTKNEKLPSGGEGKLVMKRKRAREDRAYNISDVMSKEEILSAAKKNKVENDQIESPSLKLSPEEIKNNEDSNSIIKDRLAQAVRHSARHSVDPARTFDGKPVPFQQPKLFTGGAMRWYQVEGMEWLRMLWENGINGILADEMGLGKTIQCIATVALMIERGVSGPFLVCGPLSTLPNWMAEFRRFTPKIPIMLYHGNQQERRTLVHKIRRKEGSLNIHPVVITSFEIAMRDRNSLQNLYWKYLIVDEGHRIKNMNCRLIRELKLFHTDNKLLLTGTPLQNNLAELWSLLNFLLPDVFDDLKSFESWFDISSISEIAEDIVAKKREQNILHMLHQILTPFLLRRLKSDVALEIPPKREVVVYAPLVKKQETFYSAIVNKTIRKLLGNNQEEVVELSPTGRPKRRSRKVVSYREPGESDFPDKLEDLISNMQEEIDKERPVVELNMPLDSEVNLKMQNIMMLLRKCCNHPYLIEYPLDPTTQQFKVDENLVKSSGKFLLLDRMLPELKTRGHKVLLFSQMTLMLDILMDYCYLRNYQFSRLDGSMPYAEREENMNKFNTDPEVFIFLVSTRAGGLGINLTAADTVIIYDSDWNPQSDLQAQDRCHRIGQTKPVVVYRFVTANTIDQKIVERAAAKRKLEKMIIHKNKFKGGKSGVNQSKSCLDPKELLELLQSRDYDREIKGSREKVISDKDLALLLDRTDLIDQMKTSKEVQVGTFKVLENTDDASTESVF